MAIQREIRERLLMDQALGALSSDVEALLDELVSGDDEAGCLARQIAETVAIAGAALQPPGERHGLVLPPLALGRSRSRRLSLTRRIAILAAPLAACLLIGIGVGWIIFSHIPTKGDMQAYEDPIPDVADYPETQRTEGTPRFWTKLRALARTSPERCARSYRVVWESATARPRLEKAL